MQTDMHRRFFACRDLAQEARSQGYFLRSTITKLETKISRSPGTVTIHHAHQGW